MFSHLAPSLNLYFLLFFYSPFYHFILFTLLISHILSFLPPFILLFLSLISLSLSSVLLLSQFSAIFIYFLFLFFLFLPKRHRFILFSNDRSASRHFISFCVSQSRAILIRFSLLTVLIAFKHFPVILLGYVLFALLTRRAGG